MSNLPSHRFVTLCSAARPEVRAVGISPKTAIQKAGTYFVELLRREGSLP